MRLCIKFCMLISFALALIAPGLYISQVSPPMDVDHLAVEAREALQNHDYSRAIKDYKKLIILVPSSAELFSNIGIAYHMKGELKLAEKSFIKALSLKPQLTAPYIFLGIEYSLMSRPREAVKYLQKAVEENPEDPIPRKWLAESYSDTGDYAQAVSQLLAALEKRKNDSELWFLLGENYLKLAASQSAILAKIAPDSYLILLIRAEASSARGDRDDALTFYQVVLRDHGNVPEVHLKVSDILARKGDIDAAVDECRKALTINPDDPKANLQMARLLDGNGRAGAMRPYLEKLAYLGHSEDSDFLSLAAHVRNSFPTALRQIPRLANISCKSLEGCRDLAAMLTEKRHFEAARQVWEHALKFGPLSSQMLLSLARVQFLTRRYGEVVETLGKLISEQRPPDEALMLYGRSRLELGEGSSAVEALSKVKPSSSHYPEALYFLSKAFGQLAHNAFNRLEELDPNSYWAHIVMAEALAGRGKTDEAIAEYEKVLEIKPDARLIHLAIGDLYWKKFQDRKAVDQYLTELKINPYNATANYALGHAYLGAHQLERALPYLLEAARRDPSLAYPHLDLGELYLLEKEPAKAIPALETYVRRAPNDKTGHYKLYQAYKMLDRNAKAEREMQIFMKLDEAARQEPLKKAERIRELEQHEQVRP